MLKIPPNASAQRRDQMIERKIAELEQIRDITTRIIMKAITLYPQIRKDISGSYGRGRPPLLFKYPDLHDQIHNSVEFGSVDAKRRKEVVKVLNSIAARAHHHLAWVAVAGVSFTDTQKHPDGHYCLVSVKCARQFASLFADMSVIISQDDKAKIGLGIPAIWTKVNSISIFDDKAKQLAIFVRSQWSLGTSSVTHM
ncbi:unnamed protein product [Rhizophagus irregularis]|nr:unnamed protein product [Rhizophagus irregularis]